jgi:hypothetical protein
MESKGVEADVLPLENREAQRNARRKFVDDSTVWEDVAAHQSRADIATFAANADNTDTVKRAALSKIDSVYGMRPKYLRYNLWDNEEGSHGNDKPVPKTPLDLANWTEIAKPLPTIPPFELENAEAVNTIKDNPELFKIITPVNVDRFEELLKTHPNRPFVESVCKGLREGFWPWANTQHGTYPHIVDESLGMPQKKEEVDFLRAQRDHERSKGRFSGPFGRDLLPGMHASPIHAVPKPRSQKLRMVINQSAGPFSPNSMISREDVKGFPLDDMRHLGAGLLARHRNNPSQRFVVFKSDVAEAYRLLPMHPLWQIKQIVTIDGERDVDRNNCFGGRGSAAIYISFDGLVTWIAKRVKLILELWTYMDDSFGIDEEGNLMWYHKYGRNMPVNQVKLLSLWDELDIPHESHKQLHGEKLTIIGIEVNANNLTLTLPKQSLEDLLDELTRFTTWFKTKRGTSWTLRRWQKVAGWLNWSFNVFPHIRPALNTFYPKIAGKDQATMKIWVNNEIRRDLNWAIGHLQESLGIRLLSSITWGPEDADETIFCDACMSGLAFWYPKHHTGFFATTPETAAREIIFYFEAWAVASAIENLRTSADHYSKIIIYTDSMNTVNIFNSLRCLPEFNPLLCFSIDTSLSKKFDIRVLHIAGEQNQVADAISRENFDKARNLVPGLTISKFEPPQFVALGAAKK